MFFVLDLICVDEVVAGSLPLWNHVINGCSSAICCAIGKGLHVLSADPTGRKNDEVTR